jgi:hypothetical protein
MGRNAQKTRTALAVGIAVLALTVGGLGVATAASGGAATRAGHHRASVGQATFGSGVSSHFRGGRRGILKPTPTFIARTGPLTKGTYFVSSTTTIFVPATDPAGAFCFLSTNGHHVEGDENGEDRSGFFTVAENAVVTFKAGTRITNFCSTEGQPDTGEIAHAGIFAIRIAHSRVGKVMASLPVG